MKTARIYVFGDSLVVGTYDSQGGWCDRLKRDVHRITAESLDGTKRQLYNLGIGGETSRDLAQRIEPELATRHRPEWPAVVIVGIGKNDSRLTGDKVAVPINEYIHNIVRITEVAHKITDKLVFVGIGPCASDRVLFKGFTYTREQLASYEQALQATAQRLTVQKVNIYQRLLEANAVSSVFARDQLHLNDYGYAVVYNAIKPVLMALLETD